MRQAVGVAQLHEARRLVGRIGVDRAAQVPRVAGERPTGRPSMRASAVWMPSAETGAQLQQAEPVVDEAAHRRAAVVDAQPVLRHDVAQRVVVGRRPRGQRALEEATGSGAPPPPPAASSSTSTSITPLACCTPHGPISSGVNTPSPPPSTMAGPPMPMLLSRVAMITSQQPSSAALPAKQRPGDDADAPAPGR